MNEAKHQLDDFDPFVRSATLRDMAAQIASGSEACPPLTGAVNVHYHTSFSFNGEGYSPSRVAWEAKAAGLDVAGTVDFDVLDAMHEMFEAGEILELRTVAAMETRVFMADHADKDINSPGEPGVSYFMGTGFTKLPEPGTDAAKQLDAMRATADARNRALLERLQARLAPLTLDYDKEVLSLTPAGNATERHMLEALDRASRAKFTDPKALAGYWADTLGMDANDVTALLADTPGLRNTIRKKLMKRGGAGYVQPDANTFPPMQDVIAMVLACEAIPCATWLDGTSAGEADAEKLLDDYTALGCMALNIIPDRNWNLSDADTKKIKVAKLGEIVAAAKARNLIFSVGTEMNSYGLKFVDTFDAPEMQPFAEDFRNGAYILYGHTLLQRALGRGCTSAWARDTFGQDRAKANAFYLKVGQRGFPPKAAREALAGLAADCDCDDVLQALDGLNRQQ